MKKILLAIALLFGLTFTTACGDSNPPCEKLPAPSQVEQEAARGGAEVEREVRIDDGWNEGSKAECVVVGERWVDQTDD